MHQFQLPLHQGDNLSTGLPVFGFMVDGMFIHEPTLSDCGRFDVDPLKTYGICAQDVQQLAALNKMLHDATQAALNEGCYRAQNFLGIEAGDFAGVYFSGSEHVRPIAEALADYIFREIERAAAGLVD
jgi:uncharacterized protein YunC (DUF1805 family)